MLILLLQFLRGGLTSSRCSGEPPACPWGPRGSRGRNCRALCSCPRKCSRNFLQETILMTILLKIIRGIIVKLGNSSFLFLITSKKKSYVTDHRNLLETAPPLRQCHTFPTELVWHLRQVLQQFAALWLLFMSL